MENVEKINLALSLRHLHLTKEGFIIPRWVALYHTEIKNGKEVRTSQPLIVDSQIEDGSHPAIFITEEDHNNIEWTGSPKLTWEELREAYYAPLLNLELPRIGEARDQYDEITRDRMRRLRARLTDERILHEAKQVYVGSGMSHMGSLLALIESSNEAGHSIAPILMREGDGGSLRVFFSQKRIRKLIKELSERENIVESAHNKVLIEANRQEAIAKDETKTAKERYEALIQSRELLRAFAGENEETSPYHLALQKEIDAYDPDILPDDIDELRQVWLERLEAVATQKIADLKNAATQHGVDLPESCIDQVNATRRVANKSQKGKIELRRATTGKEMKDLFDTYKFRIESVKVKNVPKWREKDGSRSYFENDGTDALELVGRQFEFTAFNPNAEPAIPGKVAAESFEVWTLEGGIFDQISAALDNENIRFRFDADVAQGTQIRVRLGARNICGPSHLHILLTAGPVPT